MRLTKAQKKLKEMGIEYEYSETQGVGSINIKDLDGRLYMVMEHTGNGNTVQGIMVSGKDFKGDYWNQKDVVEWLDKYSYRFTGGDMAKLEEERRKENRMSRYEKALNLREVKKYECYPYTLRVTTNGLGKKSFSVNAEGALFEYPSIYCIEDIYSNNDNEIPELEISLSTSSRMDVKETEDYIKKVENAIKAVKHFEEIIEEELNNQKIKNIDDL